MKLTTSLSRQAKIAEMDFKTTFSSSIKRMDALMEKIKDWKNIKKKMLNNIHTNFSIDQVSKKQAENFIQLVKTRSKGKIAPPIIETLLLFNPTYESQPIKEFNDGFRKTYINNGTKKAKGVSFSIEIPKSWSSNEAKRPNTVRQFVSDNGRGFEMIMVLVKNIALPAGERITVKDIQEILNPTDIKDSLPPNAFYKDSGPLTIENLPGFWHRYSMEASRVRTKIKMEAIVYTIYYDNKMIQIQCSVGGDEKTSTNKILKRYDKYEPLFDLVANSFVLPDKYK